MKVKLTALSIGVFLMLALPLVAMAGPTPGGADTDGDGVEDAFDNCIERSNSDQGDADHNGCGDICDGNTVCDFTGDTVVQVTDFNFWSQNLSNTPTADCTGDTVSQVTDFNAWAQTLNNVKGPSGISNPGRDTSFPDGCYPKQQ